MPLMGWKIYVTLVAMSLFFIPALIILFCYVAIIFVIFNSSQILMSVNRRYKKKERVPEPILEHTDSVDIKVHSQSSMGVIPQAKIRTIKMTFLIVLVFILCWSPYFVFSMCQVFQVFPATPEWNKVYTLVQSLAPLNSAANPLIYGVFSTRICRYIRHSPVKRSVPTSMRRCNSGTQPKLSTPEYTTTSIIETDELRMGAELRNICSSHGGNRVPLQKQELTEADRKLLSLYVREKVSVADTV
ncbi:cardioacceleratory peptide receptor-like [Physella acuta]|uniref:cardioacceleratory peptide receptor-like n=1 Tax=Physella acuta TaxID=109671 RepID=UPI0027DD09CB|nr:cardioacceleratory peptide receptor-like [Physella acuta]